MKNKKFLTLDELYDLFKSPSIKDIETIPQIKRKLDNTLFIFLKEPSINSVIDESPFFIQTKERDGSAYFNCSFVRIKSNLEVVINVIIFLPCDVLKEKGYTESFDWIDELTENPTKLSLKSDNIIGPTGKESVIKDFFVTIHRPILNQLAPVA